jgi:hypothetical protein
MPGPPDEKGQGVRRRHGEGAGAVLEALLWAFHNPNSGLCFPFYEKIAEAAGCARSSITGALKALESCGISHWSIGSSGCGSRAPTCYGCRWRVLRTSNAKVAGKPCTPECRAGVSD